jgi:hypothetical protein
MVRIKFHPEVFCRGDPRIAPTREAEGPPDALLNKANCCLLLEDIRLADVHQPEGLSFLFVVDPDLIP